MNIALNVLAALGLILSQDLRAQNDARQSIHVRPYTANAACPANNFADFVDSFSNNINLQKRFVNYPLLKQWLDLDAEPEPKKVAKLFHYHQMRFPLLPLREERIKRALEIRIDSVGANSARITLIKSGTGYQVAYFFKKESCWLLVRIEDWSL